MALLDSFTMNIGVTLARMLCPDCAGIFAISEDYRAEAQRLGNFKHQWACPYCKSERGYGQSEADRLRQTIAEKEKEIERQKTAKETFRKESDYFRRSRDGMKGALVKTKTRVGNGVCPCCNRTFPNLARHMHSKHPDYVTAE